MVPNTNSHTQSIILGKKRNQVANLPNLIKLLGPILPIYFLEEKNQNISIFLVLVLVI